MPDTDGETGVAYLDEFGDGLRIAQDCHYDCARWFANWDGALVWMSVGLAALVSTSVLADLTDTSTPVRIAIGVLSALGAVALALRQNLKYADRSELHRKTGSKYSTLYREFQEKRESITEHELEELQESRARISGKAPLIPGFIRTRYVETVGK